MWEGPVEVARLGKVADHMRTDRLCALLLGTIASHRWPNGDEQHHEGINVSSYEQLIGTPLKDKTSPPIALCSSDKLTSGDGYASRAPAGGRFPPRLTAVAS